MARGKKQDTDHVVLRNGQPFCMHCGETYTINTPARIPIVVGAINGFIEAHKNCKKTWTEPVPDMTQDPPTRAIWWTENGERGTSSETIFAVLVEVRGELIRQKIKPRPPSEWDHPHDPADFRRCHKLLEVVPELREEMFRMKPISKVWSKLVDHWDQLTEMLLAEDKGMYEFMKELGC